MVRLYLGLLRQRVFGLAVDLLGADGVVLGADDGRSWPRRYLRSFASTIGGGTADIQRDIIGYRVLGLPPGAVTVDLELSPDQEQILAASVGLLDRLDLGQPLSGDDWRRCGDMGWFGLSLAEAKGGVGYGAPEEALLFTELGRRLVAGPFLGSVLAARLAAEAGLDVAPALLAGEVGAAVLDGDGTAFAYERRPGDLGLLIRPEGAALFAADALDGATPLVGMDALTTVEAIEVAGEPIGSWATDARVWERALLLTAAALTGIAEGALGQSVEHVSSRHQFGQPIGAFQAVRHRCADMAVRVEASRSLTRFASLCVEEASEDQTFQVLSALTVARDAAITNASVNIQNHGAMGFTAEHGAHLFVKRARVLSARLGGRAQQLQRLVAASGPRFDT